MEKEREKERPERVINKERGRQIERYSIAKEDD